MCDRSHWWFLRGEVTSSDLLVKMFTPLARHSFTKLQDRRGRVDSGTSGPAETSPAWRKERLDESTQVKRKGSNKGMISCVSSPMLGLKIYIFLLFKMLSLSYIKKIKANQTPPTILLPPKINCHLSTDVDVTSPPGF